MRQQTLNMSTFAEVVKYLRRSKSRKATDADLQTSGTLTNPLKYNGTLTKSRPIQRIPVCIVLPAFSYTIDNIPELIGGLLFQYNFTNPGGSFYITKVDPVTAPQGFLTVKWRVGSTVHRYKLTPGLFISAHPNGGKMSFEPEDYSNQKVPANCVFEWWLNILPGYSEPIGLENAFRVTTGLLALPTTPDELSVDLPITQTVLGRPDLGTPLPANLPFDNTNIAWLDNP